MTENNGKDLTRAERIFVRISVLQTILAVIGIFTGAVALYAALNEADAVRKQQEASVWPRTELGTAWWSKDAVARSGEWGDAEGPVFRVTAQNSGIGPAKVSAVRVRVDGDAHVTWTSVLEKLTGRDDIQFGSSSISSRVIRAGELVNIVTLIGADAEEVRNQVSGAQADAQRVIIDLCYCSVFDTCWITTSDRSLAGSEPQSAKECPNYGEEQFLN